MDRHDYCHVGGGNHGGQPDRALTNISDDKKTYTEREFALILSKASELARSAGLLKYQPRHLITDRTGVALTSLLGSRPPGSLGRRSNT